MKLVIISGRSGSGKSSALHLLEDEGYYCIDNLPAPLLPGLIEQLRSNSSSEYQNVATSIDARNATRDLSNFDHVLQQLPDDISVDIIYLDADSNMLIKRFSETRRRHPLSDKHTALAEAIENERKLLEPISHAATLRVDTSEMGLHELRSTIKNRLVNQQGSGISILFQSFGFKQGIPIDADIVYDIRILPNPHWDPALRSLTGLDQPVRDFLSNQDEVDEMFNDISHYLDKWLPRFEQNNRSYITVAIGCTGGQHRSVYMAERLANFFSTHYENTQIRHRELHR